MTGEIPCGMGHVSWLVHNTGMRLPVVTGAILENADWAEAVLIRCFWPVEVRGGVITDWFR